MAGQWTHSSNYCGQKTINNKQWPNICRAQRTNSLWLVPACTRCDWSTLAGHPVKFVKHNLLLEGVHLQLPLSSSALLSRTLRFWTAAPLCALSLALLPLSLAPVTWRILLACSGFATLYRMPSFFRMDSTSSVNSISVRTFNSNTSSLRLCFCFFNSRMMPRMASICCACKTPELTVLS